MMNEKLNSRFHQGRVMLMVLAVFMLIVGDATYADPPESATGVSKSDNKGVAAGEPIAANSGALYFDLPLFDLGGPFPLEYRLTYRMDEYTMGTSALNSNFRDNVHIILERMPHVTTGKPVAEVNLRNGDTLQFTYEASANQWTLDAASSTRYVLKETGIDASHGYYYLMDPVREWVYIFEKVTAACSVDWCPARLLTVRDRNNNLHDYTYTDSNLNPDQIQDGLGRQLNFTYDTWGSPLIQVSDQAGRTIHITYEDNASDFNNGTVLRSVTDAQGHTTTFHYTYVATMPATAPIVSVQHPLGNTPYTQAVADVTLNAKSWVRVVSQTDAYGHTTTFDYDALENQVTEQRPDSHAVSYAHYHNNGVPKSITDPAGHTIASEQSANEQVAHITDRLGDETSLTYHSQTGKLASYCDAEGHATTFEYSARTQTFTNPVNSETVDFTFYNLTRILYPDSTSETFTYDDYGNVLTHTDRAGKAVTYTYNAQGQVLTAANPTSGVNTYTYNGDATLSTITDSDTGITTYAYDTYKRVNRMTHPDTSFVQLAYDPNDRLISLIDENTRETQFEYDANGNLAKVIDPDNQETLYEYDLMDRLISITDRLGKISAMSYDSMNRLSGITDATDVQSIYGYDPRSWLNVETRAGKTWTTTYDDEGVPTAFSTPLLHSTNQTTNKLGLVTSVTDPLNHITSFTYDVMNRVTAVTDPLNKTIQYAYDAAGRLTGVTLPTNKTVAYAYNDLGLLRQITDFNNRVWSLTYTAMGRLQSLIDPLTRSTTYSYDTRGRLSGVTYHSGQTQTITHDGAGNITRRQYTGGPDLHYTVDTQNRLLTANDMTLGRDAEGRVTSTTHSGAVFGASYDDAGRLATASYNNSVFTVTYTYDVGENGTGLLTGVSDNLTNTQITFAYDDDRRLRTITLPNSETITSTWNNADRLTRLQSGSHVDLILTYDAAGRITGVNMTAPLTPETGLTPSTQTLSFDAASQISTTGYAYDTLGRVTATPGHAFAWDGASRLTGIDAAALTYNGLGDALTRTEGSSLTRFHYNRALAGAPIVAEQDGTTSQFLRYYVWTPEGRLLYMIDASDGNKVFFYHFDQIGSTLALTDSNGQVTDAWAYDPYGRILARTGDNPQPFTFVGAWGVRQEDDSGVLYQMRARYYDATTGRFLSPDPVWPVPDDPMSLNPYQYAYQSPLIHNDPEGLTGGGANTAAGASKPREAPGKPPSGEDCCANRKRCEQIDEDIRSLYNDIANCRKKRTNLGGSLAPVDNSFQPGTGRPVDDPNCFDPYTCQVAEASFGGGPGMYALYDPTSSLSQQDRDEQRYRDSIKGLERERRRLNCPGQAPTEPGAKRPSSKKTTPTPTAITTPTLGGSNKAQGTYSDSFGTYDVMRTGQVLRQ